MESRKPATYEDLLAVPDHLVAELIHGSIQTSPRPSRRHARAATALSAEVFTRYDRGRRGPDGWVILFEPELHLGSHILVPDIAGWRRPNLPEGDQVHFTTRPDWVCEVLSPSTERLDRLVKLGIYAEHGVPWAWLVNPTQRSIEVYSLREGHYALIMGAHDEPDARLPPFEAEPLDVNALWDL